MPKKKKNKNHYFTKVHEDAIVRYCKSTDNKERNELYKVYIGPVFDEMVDKIVYTYKFNTLPNIDALRDDCKNWLITVLNKFDPDKGSKAFTYFSVVSKNWFIAQVKKTSKKSKKEVHIDDFYLDRSNSDRTYNHYEENLVVYNTYLNDRERKEFFTNLSVEINKWSSMPLRPNERKTIEAVKILFAESNQIEIFNKKAIYLYIREITGLNTKQVVSSLNKIRKKYREFKKEWDDQ
jgi:hypothetical protein